MVAKNIGTIDTLFLDATIHDSINYGKGWMWDEGSWWYAAPVSALSLNDNCIDFYVSPGKIDEPAMISTFPETDYVHIINQSRTVNDTINKKKFRIERNWINQTNIFTISGEILDTSSVDTFRRNIFDPVLFTGTVFANYLRKYGAVVQTLKKGKAKPTDILISEHYSDSLIFSMKNIMYESDNLSTELLSKSIGMNDTIPGNWSLGLKKVRIFLSDSVHIDTSKIYIADGSGVSRYNLASTDQFVELLSYMYRSSFAKDFLFTLPSGGSQGSLENRFLVMGKSIKAKTGHLSGVSNLSGYLFPPKMVLLDFQFLLMDLLDQRNHTINSKKKFFGRCLMIKAKSLRKGDCIGIISPSYWTSKNFTKDYVFFERQGYTLKIGNSNSLRWGPFAGKPEQRAEDINSMFKDPDIKAIICARGGYGANRVLDLLDYKLIKKNPKIFIGFSDITAYLTSITQKTGLVTFHGPMLVSFKERLTKYNLANMLKVLVEMKK